MTRENPRFLLINPWIYDFAAYDFWAKPLGLLKLASLLQENNVSVDFIDCLDTSDISTQLSDLKKGKRKETGCGNYLKQRIEKPDKLKDVPRYYSRYGMTPEMLETKLSSLQIPDSILITSFMTYWYPGIIDTIKVVRKVFNDVPLIIGGIYITLCEEHARKNIDADYFVTKSGESWLLKYIEEKFNMKTKRYNFTDLDQFPYPAYHLYKNPDSALIETSQGCPFSCKYCSSKYLIPKFKRRDPEKVFQEIEDHYHKLGIGNFSFADDALLWGKEFETILKLILKSSLKCKFYTPNGIHASRVDEQIAELIFEAGFSGLKLGIESLEDEFHLTLDEKVTTKDFSRSVKALQKAGFKQEDIGAYVMICLPGQTYDEAKRSVDMVIETGAKPYLTQYTPIPHSGLFDEACKISCYDLASDPIYHNNSILPLRWEKFGFKELFRLKEYIKNF